MIRIFIGALRLTPPSPCGPLLPPLQDPPHHQHLHRHHAAHHPAPESYLERVAITLHSLFSHVDLTLSDYASALLLVGIQVGRRGQKGGWKCAGTWILGLPDKAQKIRLKSSSLFLLLRVQISN